MGNYLISTNKVKNNEETEEIEVPADLLPGLYSISAMRRESVQKTVQHALDRTLGLAPDQLDARIRELKAEQSSHE